MEENIDNPNPTTSIIKNQDKRTSDILELEK